jgi:two-component system, chemotaxis family, CheB/CheR fusion protein
MAVEQPVEAFEALLDFIKRNRGFDFTGYKRPSLARRVAKRMGAIGIDDYGDYMDFLAMHPDEFVPLFDTILINVTSFFRDPAAWEYVSTEIVPRLLEEKPDDAPIRVWSVGCATGEEAFTAAMVLAEALGDDAYRERVKVYATDVDDGALSHGRHAVYTSKDVESVPEPLRQKYFEQLDGRFVFRTDLRRAVVFGRNDLLQDPPISRIDLLVARNTLMYFTPEAQAAVLATFHFALNQSGYLFLGKSEVLLTRSNLFVPVDLRRRLFRPVTKLSLRDRLLTMVEGGPHEDGRGSRDGHVRESAFEASPIAQLVVEGSGNIALVNMQARLLLGLSPRDVGRPLRDLEVSYRPIDLRTPIELVTEKSHQIAIRDVEFRTAAGETRFFDIHVAPLGAGSAGSVAVSVTFNDISRYRELNATVEHARGEVETAYEELQSSAEELETTNEELQSTNEELETTNEELQSTNEELETLNEELQSTNEELVTLNEELRQRTDDLDHVNVFLESILSSLEAATVILDTELGVRAWNDQAENLWGLRQSEVVGRHFLGLDIGLPVGELGKPLRAVLSSEEPQRIELDAVNRRGSPIRCVVTARPLRGPEEKAEGLILLMQVVEPDDG